MKTISLSFLIFLSLAISTQARIGETLEECLKRYGEPVQRPQPKTQIFHKSGIVITCYFLDGLCVQISYKKLAPQARLSMREVDILRTANGSNWQLQARSDSSRSYMRNEVCESFWDHHTGLLQFEPLAELNRKIAEKIAAEKKLLEGF